METIINVDYKQTSSNNLNFHLLYLKRHSYCKGLLNLKQFNNEKNINYSCFDYV
jgi:hypothetical protein